jgi:alpha-methylacyl-CoA racemase
MTGFGQDGPLADRAGHDINYIALSGVLSRIGRAGQPPTPPLNLVGDFGGGSMFLLFGVLCALHEARRTGQGQVVDAAMVEGSGYLMLPFFGRVAAADDHVRGTTMLDSGAPFYDAYETSDGRWVAVGAIEPQFYAALLTGLALDPADLPEQFDQSQWAAVKDVFAGVFASRTRDEWERIFEGTDACVTPVLELHELATHPQHRARQFLADADGSLQPGPVPRLSATPGAVGGPSPTVGEHTAGVLGEWLDIDEGSVSAMYRDGVVA